MSNNTPEQKAMKVHALGHFDKDKMIELLMKERPRCFLDLAKRCEVKPRTQSKGVCLDPLQVKIMLSYLRQGMKVEAVKFVRNESYTRGVSLLEAKEYVDKHLQDL